MNELFPKPNSEFNAGNNKEYKLEAIKNSTVYAKKVERHLPDLYYLVFWESYLEEENTWKSSFAIMYLWKIIFMFYKNHSEKLTAIFFSLILLHLWPNRQSNPPSNKNETM